ncbi:MAG: M23 family metallopeptidase, partial [Anaerolineae bacterium]
MEALSPLTNRRWQGLLAVLLLLGGLAPICGRAQGTLALQWPFEPGRDWLILQGYNNPAGNHNSLASGGAYMYAFDLVLADASLGTLATRTAGQPVLAAGAGELVSYDPANGGLLLRHGRYATGGAYMFTVYLHIDPSSDLPAPGGAIAAGQVIGSVAAAGTRGSGGTAHLHFALISSMDPSCPPGTGAPEPFNDRLPGYSFPFVAGRQNQYQGTVVRAPGPPESTAQPSPTDEPLPTETLQATVTLAPTTSVTPTPSATPAPAAAAPPTATPPPAPPPTESVEPSLTLTEAATATPSPSGTSTR